MTVQAYQQFMEALAGRLKTGAQVSLVADLGEFELYEDLDVPKNDLKFAFGEYRHIHRQSAYLGHQKWLVWFTRLVNPFTRAEEKHFPLDKFQAALDWACA